MNKDNCNKIKKNRHEDKLTPNLFPNLKLFTIIKKYNGNIIILKKIICE